MYNYSQTIFIKYNKNTKAKKSHAIAWDFFYLKTKNYLITNFSTLTLLSALNSIKYKPDANFLP